MALLIIVLLGVRTQAAEGDHWVATWGASPSPQMADEAKMRDAKLTFNNQTLREIVHLSIGGDTLRIRLSNAYGKQAVEIRSAHVALRAEGATIVPGSDHALTFSGQAGVTIPPNALVLSDPVVMQAPGLNDVAISLFLPNKAMGAGIHYSAQQTSYIAPGNMTAAASLPGAQTMTHWAFLTGVDILQSQESATLVAFGDSITDGAASSVDANRRWPNLLTMRIAEANRPIGVLDAGIGGNRILHDAVGNVQFGVNALARFDRDVLAQAGVKYVIVLEGINDLGHPGSSAPLAETVSAQDLIGGLEQMVERCHEKGIRIYGGTLTPFAGTVFHGYYSEEKEAKRQAINQWIRTSHAFDGVIDFEHAVEDPAQPGHIRPAYDSGDHLHPNDAGYKAMAEAIDLSLFQ